MNGYKRIWVQVLSIAEHYDWEHKFIVNTNRFYLKPHNSCKDYAIEDLLEFNIMTDKTHFFLLFRFTNGHVDDNERYLFYDKDEAVTVFNKEISELECCDKGYKVTEQKRNGDMMCSIYTKNFKGVYEWMDTSIRWVLIKCHVVGRSFPCADLR
jgi:hypothetical protein